MQITAYDTTEIISWLNSTHRTERTHLHKYQETIAHFMSSPHVKLYSVHFLIFYIPLPEIVDISIFALLKLLWIYIDRSLGKRCLILVTVDKGGGFLMGTESHF